MQPKRTIDDMRVAAAYRGGQCLSPAYKDRHTPLTWRCGCGAEFHACFRFIEGGLWCPVCPRAAPRCGRSRCGRSRGARRRHARVFPPESAPPACGTVRAEPGRGPRDAKGGRAESAPPAREAVGAEPGRGPSDAEGARAESAPPMREAVRTGPGRAPSGAQAERAESAPPAREAVGTEPGRGLSDAKGGRVDDPNRDARAHLGARKHAWYEPKHEDTCRRYFEWLTGAEFPTARPGWLGTLELDGFNEELNLAFEYQGRQHYEVIPRWHGEGEVGEASLRAQKERDARKARLCRARGVDLVAIPYWVKNKERFIRMALEALGYETESDHEDGDGALGFGLPADPAGSPAKAPEAPFLTNEEIAARRTVGAEAAAAERLDLTDAELAELLEGRASDARGPPSLSGQPGPLAPTSGAFFGVARAPLAPWRPRKRPALRKLKGLKAQNLVYGMTQDARALGTRVAKRARAARADLAPERARGARGARASDPVLQLPRELVRLLWAALPVEACILCACVSRAWRAALVAAGAPLEAGLRVSYFVGTPALLAWARAQRPRPRDERVSAAAARGARLATLQWARALPRPCRWDERTCSAAAANGHLAVLRWARAQNPRCPWDEGTCSGAAKGGHLEVLRWARAQSPPCPWDEWTCAEAAAGGHLELLQWARAQSPPCPWDESTCAEAAKGAHLGVLQWARARAPPCPWDELTCAEAAKGGHLGVLQWARAEPEPAPWDERTCAGAARGGRLEILRWARAQDPPCPWGEATTHAATAAQEFEVLCWLRAQREPCPWSRSAMAFVERSCPSFLESALVWVGRSAEEASDRALVRIGRAAPGRGASSIGLNCGSDPELHYQNFRLAFFGDAESALAHVRSFILGHLYQVFKGGWYEIMTWIGGKEADLVEDIKMVADRSVEFGPGREPKVLDPERAAENGGHPVYDDWEGSGEELAAAAARDAFENLQLLAAATQTWLPTEGPTVVCKLSALRYSRRVATPTFSALALTFAFPGLPAPTGRLPLPPSRAWD
jgi:hypothetical protein